jgi:Domain of unknown function (DUF4345)
MKILNTLVLAIAGLGFIGFGIAFLFWPDALLTGIGIQASSTQASIEIRAMYGGLELGLGIFLLSCLATARQRTGLWLSLASYGGLGLARLASMLLLGASSPFLVFALVWEGVVAALALLALNIKTRSN